MTRTMVHLCYAGTSGSSRVALDIAAGSARPSRHAYVLYGVGPVRPDYLAQLDRMGCTYRHIAKKAGFDPACYVRVARVIRSLHPGAVLLHGDRTLPVEFLLKLRRRIRPILAVQHGPLPWEGNWRRVVRLFSRLADATVCVSQEVADQLVALGRYRTTVIPNGIDLAYWLRSPRLIPSDGPVRVVMAATLEERKDQATLIRAIGLLRDRGRNVHLELLGSGSRESQLRQLTAELRLQTTVTFSGNRPRDYVRDCMASADILAHTARGEAFPLAILEGIASGLPVVAADALGIRSLGRDGQTGLLAPPGDAFATADAIERYLADPPLALRLAQAAQRQTQEYTIQRMAEGYERYIESLVGAIQYLRPWTGNVENRKNTDAD